MSIDTLALYGYLLSIPIVIYLGRYFISDDDWKHMDLLWVILSFGAIPAIVAIILLSPVIGIVILLVYAASRRRGK